MEVAYIFQGDNLLGDEQNIGERGILNMGSDPSTHHCQQLKHD